MFFSRISFNFFFLSSGYVHRPMPTQQGKNQDKNTGFGAVSSLVGVPHLCNKKILQNKCAGYDTLAHNMKCWEMMLSLSFSLSL